MTIFMLLLDLQSFIYFFAQESVGFATLRNRLNQSGGKFFLENRVLHIIKGLISL